MKILMLSSSKVGDGGYLESAKEMIVDHLQGISNVLFIPFAGVTVGWDDYTQAVSNALPELQITGIHQHEDPKQAVLDAEAILVGGGNTFNLLNQLYQQDLIVNLKAKVASGMPYIGWSAGSNICGNSIRTTNDMPIIEPPSFDALSFVPFQLNPHYSDYHPPGFNGETRAQRIAEFCVLNPQMPVIGIREGTALQRIDNSLTLLGELNGVVFIDQEQLEISPGQDLSEYL